MPNAGNRILDEEHEHIAYFKDHAKLLFNGKEIDQSDGHATITFLGGLALERYVAAVVNSCVEYVIRSGLYRTLPH